MYVPNAFRNENVNEVKEFVRNNAFGILINKSSNKLLATHIPFELTKNDSGKDILQGHLSKANEQWKEFENNSEVLAIFTGSHAYISSSWYDHENVPTWNYIAVHIYGKIKIIEGDDLKRSLKRLVDNYEKSSKHPVRIEDMSSKFFNREIRGIVGFEIEITEIQSAYKLSQNRDHNNYSMIIEALEKRGDSSSKEVASEMRKKQNDKKA